MATGSAARARIEIGNAATYNGSTNMTVLTPTAWNNTAVTTIIHQGSFTSGQQAYLYVVDSTGAVNANGYQITIGGTGDTTPPACPVNLTVQ